MLLKEKKKKEKKTLTLCLLIKFMSHFELNNPFRAHISCRKHTTFILPLKYCIDDGNIGVC